MSMVNADSVQLFAMLKKMQDSACGKQAAAHRRKQREPAKERRCQIHAV